MNRSAAVVSLLVGGFAATIALASTMSGSFAVVTDSGRADVLIYSAAAGATLGAITAVVAVVLVRSRPALAWTATLGLVLLAVMSSLPGSGRWELYPHAIGAGLILGALAGLCDTQARPVLQTALATGALAGVLLAVPLERYRSPSPRRYADYLPASAVPADVFMLGLLAMTAVALFIALRRGAFGVSEPALTDGRVRVLAVGVAVPVVGLLLHWSFVRVVGSMSSTWLFGLAVVPVFVVGSLLLPRRNGMVLLAALAVIATSYRSLEWSTDSLASLLIAAVLVVLGAVCGRRWPHPLAGVATLAVVAATAVFEEQPWDTLHTGATVLVLPLAAAFTVVACLPSSAAATAISLAAPAAVSVPLMARFGWTLYAPLRTSHNGLSSDSWLWVSTGVAVATVVVSGITIAWLQRRPMEQSSAEAPG
ncbi:hypothetical protein [Rhodococcus sp. MTM3W5.2]|uniref:hypothetical protein n=1 Tax=Rhodococcus sp. MTM3W5.2 TaxID=1805827 RepID=UPI00097C824B|nr:hypothetical protein [Rhodococcus sp. MTM3W5.2]